MRYMDYIRQDKLPTYWCAGCGYGQVMHAMARAFEKLDFSLENTVIVSGIGCWGGVDAFFRVNAFHGTHGRALPVATGIKLANPGLDVIVVMGDGDGVTIGGNHFIHAARRNVDLTAIVCNNYNYGMTGGQYSSTTPPDSVTATSRYGHIEESFDICQLAQATGASFVARSLSENVFQTMDLIVQGARKKGFSMIEVLSPCPTYYGRNNAMKAPAELYRQLKRLAVPIEAADRMSQEQLMGKLLTGVLTNRECVDYGTKYRELLEKAQRGKED